MSAGPLIQEQGSLASAAPAAMDFLWSQGWRHFGCDFFRYNLTLSESGSLLHILPLRLVLEDFIPSRGQRRVMRKNADLRVEIGPALVDEAREAMFLRHRERFSSNVPDSLKTFLPEPDPATTPCECRELRVLAQDRLLAVSFLDCGAEAVSSVYAMFEPEESARSLGIFTLLEEIAFARRSGRRFLYHGYATREASHYDYKKAFTGLQAYDWTSGEWRPFPDPASPSSVLSTP